MKQSTAVAWVATAFFVFTACRKSEPQGPAPSPDTSGTTDPSLSEPAATASNLTEGTRRILERLDQQLKADDDEGFRSRLRIELYATKDESIIPPKSAEHAIRAEAMLGELKALSMDRIEIEIIDLKKGSAEEQRAKLNDITPVPVFKNEKVYLGISLSYWDEKRTIPFLDPDASHLLEYELARAISELGKPEKPRIGLISSYPLQGDDAGSQPWYVYTRLEQEFSIEKVPLSADKIDPDIDALLVIHPVGISEEGQQAIDQYLLAGGKVLAMLDPFSLHQRMKQAAVQPIPGAPPAAAPPASDMKPLLSAWGIRFDPGKVVADRRYLHPRSRAPVIISVPKEGIEEIHPITTNVRSIDLSFTGAFEIDAVDGIDMQVLLRSSADAFLTDPALLFGDQNSALRALRAAEASPSKLAFAVRLRGQFNSAFPAGDRPLKKSQQAGEVVLVADSDLISDESAPQRIKMGNGQMIEAAASNDNFTFVANLLNQLTGDIDLLDVLEQSKRARTYPLPQK